MKNLTSFVAMCFLLCSCVATTLPIIPVSRIDKIFFKPEIGAMQRSDYEIIKVLTGTGNLILNFTPIKTSAGKIFYAINNPPENVFKMGYFHENIQTVSEFQFPQIRCIDSVYVVEFPEKLVESNAVYDLIVKADDVGADAIITPRFKIEVNRTGEKMYYNCSVKAIAIRFKRDLNTTQDSGNNFEQKLQ